MPKLVQMMARYMYCQAILRINAGLMLIGPFGTNSHEILINTAINGYNNSHARK